MSPLIPPVPDLVLAINLLIYNNLSRHLYFHRLPGLWNAIPIIDLNQSFEVIKSKSKIHFWNHFVENFNDSNHCTLHYQCPYSVCHTTGPLSLNLSYL